MAKVEELIGALHREGAVDARGAFTIDRDKAREKMRQFQLPDPRRYVLLLVQAACLKGARKIEFRIDADDMHMHCDGTPFTVEDFEELYTSLFGGGTDPQVRARRDLAVALNAAMALEPRHAIVECGDADGRGIRLVVRPGRPEEIQVDQIALAEGTHIHVKHKFGTETLLRFFRKSGVGLEEEQFIRDACKFSEAAITVYGERISQGMTIGEPMLWTRVRSDEATGLAGLLPDPTPATLRLLVNGVRLTEHRLEHFFPGFRAMVDASALRKDVSHTDVVRDDAYERLNNSLRRTSRRLLVALFRRLSGSTTPNDVVMELSAPKTYADAPTWMKGAIRQVIAAFGARLVSTKGSDELAAALAQLPVWQPLVGPPQSTASLAASSEKVRYATEGFAPRDLANSQRDIIRLDDTKWREVFVSVFEGRAENATQMVLRSRERARRKRAFRQREHPIGLGEGVFVERERFEADQIEGEVGVRWVGTDAARIVVLLDGCVLWEQTTSAIPIPGLVAVVQGPVRPTVGYERAHRDEALARGLLETAEAIHRLMAGMAARFPSYDDVGAARRCLLGYLEVCACGTLERVLLQIFEYKDVAIQRHLAGRSAAGPDLEGGLKQRDPFFASPLFEADDGRFVSLYDVDAARREVGEVRVLSPSRARRHDVPQLLVRADRRAMAIFEAVFGKNAVKSWDREYERWLTRQHRLELPPDPLDVPESCALGAFDLEVPDARLRIGITLVTWMAASKGRAAKIRLLTDHRWVCDLELSCPVPGVVAAIDVDDLKTNAEWTALASKKELRRVAKIVFSGLARLVEVSAERFAASPDDLEREPRIALLAAASAPLARSTWVHAHRRLVEDEGADEARHELAGLVELADAFGDGAVSAAVHESMQQGSLPTASEVQKRLKAKRADKNRPDVSLAGLRTRVLRVWPMLEKLPLLCGLGGRASLELVRRSIERDGSVLFVPDEHRRGSDAVPERLVLRLERLERVFLEAIVGSGALEDGSSWLETWDKQQEFRNRPQISPVLDPSDVLVAVPVDDDGTEGELGVPRTDPTEASTSIQVCHRRRPICRVSPMLMPPVVGVLSNGHFGVALDFERLDEFERAQVERIVDQHRPALHKALAAAYPKMGERDQALADAWVLQALRWDAAGTRADPAKLVRSGVDALIDLPVLLGLDGNRISASDLSRAYKDQPIPFVLAGARVPDAEKPVIVLRNEPEREALTEVFVELVDYVELAKARAEAQKRRRAAPSMPEPPRRVLAEATVQGRGLTGKLWIDPRQQPDACICFGDEGKVVAAFAVSELLPCCGAIEGSSVRVSDDWTSVDLRSRQRELLLRETIGLYETMARSYAEAAEGRADTTEASFTARLRQMVDELIDPDTTGRLLRDAAVRMHEEKRRGRRWTDGRYRRLYRRLRNLPLFALSTGRRISLSIALRERPIELAHFELWAPAPPQQERDSDDEVSIRPEQVKPSPARADPKPEPKREPESRPPPPPPSREALLIEAIRAELRVVRQTDRTLLEDAHLDLIRWADAATDALVIAQDGALLINARHRTAQTALDHFDRDSVWISFLASATYTTLNAWKTEITDEDETTFTRLHATHILTGK